ncbi:MAG: choice-of-anchor tandem repeat GloVer-containing protein, partial [Bacteroidota bacterium]
GSLLLAADNKLYGMAYGGGSSFSGTIFRLNTDGSGFQVIHHFNYTDGALPNGSLIIDNNTGFLYGTTERGGSSDMGIVFRIKQDGSLFQKLFNFNGSNGKYPKGDLLLLPPTGAKTASRYFNTSEKSIPAITAAIVDVFPNPVQHAFMLHCKQPAAGQIIYSVADIKGKLIRQQTISHASTDLYQQVDITALPAGIYILKVTMQAQLFTKKIVKQ